MMITSVTSTGRHETRSRVLLGWNETRFHSRSIRRLISTVNWRETHDEKLVLLVRDGT